MTGLTGMTSMYDTGPVKQRRVADGGPQRAPHRPCHLRRHRGGRAAARRQLPVRTRAGHHVRRRPAADPRGPPLARRAGPDRDASRARHVRALRRQLRASTAVSGIAIRRRGRQRASCPRRASRWRCEAASLAAERATPADIDEPGGCPGAARAERGRSSTCKRDLAFHLAIAAAAHNPVIEMMLESIAPLTVGADGPQRRRPARSWAAASPTTASRSRRSERRDPDGRPRGDRGAPHGGAASSTARTTSAASTSWPQRASQRARARDLARRRRHGGPRRATGRADATPERDG